MKPLNELEPGFQSEKNETVDDLTQNETQGSISIEGKDIRLLISYVEDQPCIELIGSCTHEEAASLLEQCTVIAREMLMELNGLSKNE